MKLKASLEHFLMFEELKGIYRCCSLGKIAIVSVKAGGKWMPGREVISFPFLSSIAYYVQGHTGLHLLFGQGNRRFSIRWELICK